MRRITRSVLALSAAAIVIGGTLVISHSHYADTLAGYIEKSSTSASSISPPSQFFHAPPIAPPRTTAVTPVIFTSSRPLPDESSQHRLFLDSDGSLHESSHGHWIQLSAASALEKIITPQGNIYAFFDNRAKHWTIALCHTDGTLIHRMPLASDQADLGNAILSFHALRSGLLFLELHINPDLSVGVTIDPRTHQWHTILGCCFAWNEAGSHLAYDVEPPHLSEHDASATASIYLDGQFIRHVAAGSLKSITWTDDSDFQIQAATTSGEPRTFKARCDLSAKQQVRVAAAAR